MTNEERREKAIALAFYAGLIDADEAAKKIAILHGHTPAPEK